MKIEVGKFYKTMKGLKARIYTTEAGDPYPIHGAYLERGVWTPCCWHINGQRVAGEPHHDNIISEWSDNPARLVAWLNPSGAVGMFPEGETPPGGNENCRRLEWLDEPKKATK